MDRLRRSYGCGWKRGDAVEIMDSRVPKSEREHAACREIEILRARIATLEAENTALKERLEPIELRTKIITDEEWGQLSPESRHLVSQYIADAESTFAKMERADVLAEAVLHYMGPHGSGALMDALRAYKEV